MKFKLQTIYEYLKEFSEDEIDSILSKLSSAELTLIKDRYGSDLHNPLTSTNWNKTKSHEFYNELIPKIKKLLKEEKSNQFNNDLLRFLKDGKTNEEICSQLNIDNKELYDKLLDLKNNGLLYKKTYYSDGTIFYNKFSGFKDLKQYNISQVETIITDISENDIKFLLISDLHIGNDLERLDLIDRTFNYATKNGIHLILYGGNFIDGTYTKGTQKIAKPYEQLKHLIDNYPYDKSILTFGVGGDHDMSILKSFSIDIVSFLNNYRHDIIIGGYNNAIISVKNDIIHLFHHIDGGMLLSKNAPIILQGHLHKYVSEFSNDELKITILSLSDILHQMPSALELNLSFNKGYIKSALVKQIYFASTDVILNEAEYNFTRKNIQVNESLKNVKNILYELEFSEESDEKTKRLSQIEKFNQKYGNI